MFDILKNNIPLVIAISISIGIIIMITKLFVILPILVIILSLIIIFSQIKEHYEEKDPKLQEIRMKLESFFNSKSSWKGFLSPLNNRNIMDEINLYKGNKSYTINKEKVYVCVKDDKDKYYTDNTLMYVIAHELSHVICDEIGHTEKFHQIFEELLSELIDYGIYDPSIVVEKNYCNYDIK